MSLKQLAVPFFVLSLAAFGCSSSNNSTGAAGSGGGSAGTGAAGTGAAGTDAGAAGTGAAGTGVAGTGADAAAGTGADAAAGTGADAAAGVTGTDGGLDTIVDTGVDAVNLTADETLCATKRTEMMSAVAYSAADFCAVYADICGATAFTGALTTGDCITMYNSWAGKTVAGAATSVQSCVSYHVCNAQTMEKALHCPHAAGMAPCAP
jgi:hypothetical protein